MATIPIFDGTNYKIWSVKMKTLLLSMDLWDTVQNGYDDETNKEKQQKDAAALYHIQQGVSDQIFPRIKDATKAKQAWGILSEEPTRPHYRNVIRVTPRLEANRGKPFDSGYTCSNCGLYCWFHDARWIQWQRRPKPRHGDSNKRSSFQSFYGNRYHSHVVIHFSSAHPLLCGWCSNNGDEVEMLVHRAAYLTIYATMAMVLAFVTGTYAVLAHSSGLAISVCVIGCLPLLYFLNTRIMVLRGRYW